MAPARDARENARIDYLIHHLETLQGSVFIRNGSEHSPEEAGKHLRMKLEKAGGRVKTAEEFIENCAARSYLSGKPYKIRLPDGVIKDAGPFLLGILRKR